MGWWFSGDSQDVQAAHDDPPETPAHAFVTRAFKQAIFGTPAQPQAQRAARPRTQSFDERRPYHNPRAANASAAAVPKGRAKSNSFDLSPARPPGILLTPGTGGNRRKSVTFDPRDAKKLALNKELDDSGGESRKGLKPDDFTSRLRGNYQPPTNVRHSVAGMEDVNGNDHAPDAEKPRSSSGKYWKAEFEAQRDRSALEIRKLTKKEEVAKKYAQSRESAVQRLEEELRLEQNRAADLELQVEDFRARIKTAVSESSAHNRKDPSVPRRRVKEDIVKSALHQPISAIENGDLARLEAENETLREQLAEQKRVSSTYLKSKESEISRLRKAKQDLKDEKRQLEAELAEQRRISSAHAKSKDLGNARPQAQSDSPLASTPRRQRSTREPSASKGQDAATAQPMPMTAPTDPASDIWADQADYGKPDSLSKSPRRRPTSRYGPDQLIEPGSLRDGQASPARKRHGHADEQDRAPLTARDSASLNTAAAPTESNTPGKSNLSYERRAAAKQRLEERRRMRETNEANGATVSKEALG